LRELRFHQGERGGIVVSKKSKNGIGLVNHGAQFSFEE